MPGNSPMVSLRIPEDHLLELDRLVGFDGMRNRSDVSREAVRRMLLQDCRRAGRCRPKTISQGNDPQGDDRGCHSSGPTQKAHGRVALQTR